MLRYAYLFVSTGKRRAFMYSGLPVHAVTFGLFTPD